MSHEDCPGVPYECAGALARIEQALDGQITPTRAAEIRLQFEECQPCLVAYDIELKLHVTLSEECREAAPVDLRGRIGEALARIDLMQIEITDL
jgi:mycothiol system anti-sigma-R factor